MPPTRRAFLLRIDPSVLDAVQHWANDDLRSLNGQIEFVLRGALARAGRSPSRAVAADERPTASPATDDEGIDGDD